MKTALFARIGLIGALVCATPFAFAEEEESPAPPAPAASEPAGVASEQPASAPKPAAPVGFVDPNPKFTALPKGTISGQNAVTLITSFEDMGGKLAPFSQLGMQGRPIPLESIQWPLPSDIHTVRVTPGDLVEFQTKFGFGLSSLSRVTSQMGGQLDIALIQKLLEYVELKKINDREYEITIRLRPIHCKMSQMDEPKCKRDRIYIPGQNPVAFNAMIRAHEQLRLAEQVRAGEPCKVDDNSAFDLIPSLGALADAKEDDVSAQNVRILRDRFRASYGVDLQSIDLDPRIRMRVSLEADSQGDAVVRVNRFEGIEAHLSVPAVTPMAGQGFWTGLLDKFTQGAMNGTLEFFPTEIMASKSEFKSNVAGLLGAFRAGYSSKSGVEVMGFNQDSGIVRFFTERMGRGYR